MSYTTRNTQLFTRAVDIELYSSLYTSLLQVKKDKPEKVVDARKFYLPVSRPRPPLLTPFTGTHKINLYSKACFLEIDRY